jgi:hypothetical protein
MSLPGGTIYQPAESAPKDLWTRPSLTKVGAGERYEEFVGNLSDEFSFVISIVRIFFSRPNMAFKPGHIESQPDICCCDNKGRDPAKRLHHPVMMVNEWQ